MFRYDKGKLDNRLYTQVIHKWIKQQLISVDIIPEAYVRDSLLYKPYNWLKRAGLYLLTTLAIQSCIGFLFFFFLQALDMEFDGKPVSLLLCLSGVTLFILLNRYVRGNNVYKQGTDDAWLHAAVCYTYSGLIIFLNVEADTDPGMLFIAFSLFAVTGFAGYAFADSFMSVICLLCLNYIPLYIVSMIGRELLFFSALFIVPLNIVVISTLNRWDKLKNHYWYGCFNAGRVVACLMMYVSVNLYVIRTLAFELMGAETIPMQPVFFVLTLLTPLFYIVWGIRQKMKYLLYSGLVLVLPTVATIRYYYSVMPVEQACMVGGLILIVVCYAGIHRLRQTESRYTFEADPEEDFSDAEVLVLLQQFGRSETHPHTESRTGGGEFGGGGSGGGF